MKKQETIMQYCRRMGNGYILKCSDLYISSREFRSSEHRFMPCTTVPYKIDQIYSRLKIKRKNYWKYYKLFYGVSKCTR